MKTWVRRSLNAGALTAGAILAAGTAAHADTTLVSSDNTGILNGTQAYAPIQLPVNACGLAVGVLGDADAGCEGGASSINEEWGWAHYLSSTGNTGILNGTQVYAPIQAPVNACGIAAGVIGTAHAGCQGGASATSRHQQEHGKNCGCAGHRRQGESATTESLPLVGSLSGLTGGLPLIGGLLHDDAGLTRGLPLIGGLLNKLTSGDNTEHRTESDGGPTGNGGTKTTPRPKPKPKPKPQPRTCEHVRESKITQISGGNTGILNGTQIYAPVQIPIDISGIAIGVLGNANARSQGGAAA